jgi:predicted nucleic acid-binding protein
LRPIPTPGVLAWLDSQTAETLFLTTISLAEMRYGVERLPAGRRRETLYDAVENQVTKIFAGRLLSFDEPATRAYARVAAVAKAAGVNVTIADALIAAIATAHGFAVATRNEMPFDALGVPVINPWR